MLVLPRGGTRKNIEPDQFHDKHESGNIKFDKLVSDGYLYKGWLFKLALFIFCRSEKENNLYSTKTARPKLVASKMKLFRNWRLTL